MKTRIFTIIIIFTLITQVHFTPIQTLAVNSINNEKSIFDISKAQTLQQKYNYTALGYGIWLGIGIPAVVTVVIISCIFWGISVYLLIRIFKDCYDVVDPLLPHQNDRRTREERIELFLNNLFQQIESKTHGISTNDVDKHTTLIKKFEGADARKYNNENFTCSICTDQFGDSEVFRKLPCHHIFHKDCIDRWLEGYNSTCPECRHSVLSKDAVPEIPEDKIPLVKKEKENINVSPSSYSHTQIEGLEGMGQRNNDMI